jgi:hypothetical protein
MNNINIDSLCILKYENGKVIISYEPIEDYFQNERVYLKELCALEGNNIKDIVVYLKQTKSLWKLQRKYSHCIDLDKISKPIHADIKLTTEKLTGREKRLLSRLECEESIRKGEGVLSQEKDYEFENTVSRPEPDPSEIEYVFLEIKNLEKELSTDFEAWLDAYNIMKSYDKCKLDKNIIAFSHKKRGWSNPIIKMTNNFSIEIKTNFGFGNASYFYITLTYKNIVIGAYSDWVSYKYAKYSDIIRYSYSLTEIGKKSYGKKTVTGTVIKDSSWKEAMEYSRIACNLSLTDEKAFLDKYVMGECEKMVGGLEKIYHGKNLKGFEVDKKGYKLIEYKGEKISGALDFINHILEFQNHANIKPSVLRIEDINEKIQPLLSQEIIQIRETLKSLYPAHLELKKNYSNYSEKRKEYMKKKNKMRNEIKNYKVKVKDVGEEVEKKFKVQFPEFEVFNEELELLVEPWNKSKEEISILEESFKKISLYNDKILGYFDDK